MNGMNACTTSTVNDQKQKAMKEIALLLDRIEMEKNSLSQKGLEPTEGIQTVTPEQAAHWLSSYMFERQRSLKRDHVNRLAEEIKAGRYQEKMQIYFCRLDGRLYLVNGQHTLTSLVQAGVPLLLSVIVTDVRDMEGVAAAYSRIDTNSIRLGSDALYAHRIDEELGVNKKVLQYVTSAAIHYAYFLNEISYKAVTRLTHDQKVQIVRRHGPLVLEAARQTGLPWSAKRMRWATRKSFLASLTFTYHHQPHVAINFWGDMFLDDGLTAKDPRKVLLEDYKQSSFNNGTVGRIAKENLVTDQDIPKMAAVAWNAYMERRALTFIRYDRTKRSAEFRGCGEVPV